MDADDVHRKLKHVGSRVAALRDADDEIERVRRVRTASEFKAFLEREPLAGSVDDSAEFVAAASGSAWEKHRDLLVHSAEDATHAHERGR